jgi:hypothetical protein
MLLKTFHIFALGLLCAFTALPVLAQEENMPSPNAIPSGNAEVEEISPNTNTPMPPPGSVDILPAKSLSTEELSSIDPEEPTHPELRLTPDKSAIVRLDAEAGTVVIGNPNHISILAENTKTLVIVPKMPGATYFTIMDATGNVIMQRHVIVASPKEKYVRVRRSCATAENENCQATQVYYCPDMCHEIVMTPDAKQQGDKITEAELKNENSNADEDTSDDNKPQPQVGSDDAGNAE